MIFQVLHHSLLYLFATLLATPKAWCVQICFFRVLWNMTFTSKILHMQFTLHNSTMVNGFMYCITTCTCIWCNSKKKENNPSNQHKQQARKATPHDHWIATTCNTVKNKIFESPVTDNNISAARNNGCTICLEGTSQKVPTLEAKLVVAFWFSHQSFYLIIHVLEYEL